MEGSRSIGGSGGIGGNRCTGGREGRRGMGGREDSRGTGGREGSRHIGGRRGIEGKWLQNGCLQGLLRKNKDGHSF